MKPPSRPLIPRLLRKVRSFTNPAIVNVAELTIGRNVVIEHGVEINCGRLVIGDGVTIRSGTKIDMPDLVIGDYTTIMANCLLDGTDWCRIGHNCWFGHFTIVDSLGTTLIGNGVGVGAHSQLWTHAYFGDMLAGCRFASQHSLVIEDEVWFVGHCIVSPIHAKRRSMAMVGSVVTRDMEENHVYAGVPAKDVTERFGPQFNDRDISERREIMEGYLAKFCAETGHSKIRLRIVDVVDPLRTNETQFGIADRVYTKRWHPEEIAFMKFLLPTKAKFLPHESTDWVGKHLRLPAAMPSKPDGFQPKTLLPS